jgi:nucleotide-binding universal stress UspA family protein
MPIIGKHPSIELDTVVFATDFSPASHNAGLYASAISVHFHTDLVVAHAFTLLQAALEVEVGDSKPSQQRIDLNHALSLTAKLLNAGRGTTESILLEGDPSSMVPQFSQHRSSSLIVLGTHGGGAIDRLFLGSTAEGILRRSSGPAITIGPRVNILKAGALKIKRILYATDCTPEAAYAASVAVVLADAFSAELDVLNVVRTTDIDHPEQFHQVQQHFYGAVEAAVPRYADQICQPHTFVSVGQPHIEILKHVDERKIDILILGLRRNAHLGMQSRTSGAFPIIVEATCPVVTMAFGSTHHP